MIELANLNVFFLVLAIVMLLGYLIFLSKRKDLQIIKNPPSSEKLPNIKYNKALQELNKFKAQPVARSRKAQITRNAEQYYLERRLDQILRETEKEQQNYNIACKEREIAWRDHYDFFQGLNFFTRTFSLLHAKELRILRNLFLEAERKAALEEEKLTARIRIKSHEEQVIGERNEEIERKTLQATLDKKTISETQPASPPETGDILENESKFAEDVEYHLPNAPVNNITLDSKAMQDAFAEIQLHDDAMDEEVLPMEVPKRIRREKEGGKLTVNEESTTPILRKHFGQDDFNDKYPEFSGLTYIDECLSFDELNIPVVRNANFDKSFFVSVLFKGVHQYQDCSFINTDFSQSLWQCSDSPHRILNCNFTASNFVGASLEFMAFYNCEFFGTNFFNVQLKMVKFVNCRFENCLIRNVDFSETVMSLDMLESIDFSECLQPPKNAAYKQEKIAHLNSTLEDEETPQTPNI